MTGSDSESDCKEWVTIGGYSEDVVPYGDTAFLVLYT